MLAGLLGRSRTNELRSLATRSENLYKEWNLLYYQDTFAQLANKRRVINFVYASCRISPDPPMQNLHRSIANHRFNAQCTVIAAVI